jgi:hypothetical protein
MAADDREVWPSDVPWPNHQRGMGSLSSTEFERLWQFVCQHPAVNWHALAENWYRWKPQGILGVEEMVASMERKARSAPPGNARNSRQNHAHPRANIAAGATAANAAVADNPADSGAAVTAVTQQAPALQQVAMSAGATGSSLQTTDRTVAVPQSNTSPTTASNTHDSAGAYHFQLSILCIKSPCPAPRP